MMPNIETNEIQKESQDQIVEEALERLKRKLLDLSRRNSLLNFKVGRNSIRIVDELPDVIFEYLVNKGKSMVLNPLPDPKPEAENTEIKTQNILLFEVHGHEKEGHKEVKAASSNDIDTNYELPTANGAESEKKYIDNKLQTDLVSQVLERRCKKIFAECRRSIEESGINIFFLAIGFLEWYEDDNSDIKNKAPLILIPVSIERTVLDRESNCYRYVISYNEEDIETNLSLIEKLSINFNIIMPFTEEFTSEEYFVKISNAVSHKRRWRVAREAILGFFSFAKIRIYKDLCASDGGSGFIASHPLVKQIIAGREREEKEYHVTGRMDDIDIDEYEKENAPLLLVREADSSQYSAVVDVVHNGKNLCIEGPPGTGKSQTITNIIANALCNDKSVLFVSEKKAALEVVRNRLNQHELGDYCLELHSQKTQKIKLYEDLGKRLAIGNISNPANLDIEIKRLEEEKDKLKKYYNILNKKPAATDDTIYEIFWKTDRWLSGLNTEPPHFSLEAPLRITNGTITELIRIVEDFVKLREELPDDIYLLWHGFEPNVLVPGDDEEIRVWLEEIIEAFQKFDSFFKEFIETHSLPESPCFSSADRLSAIDRKIVSVPPDVPLGIYQKLFDPNNTALVNELSNKIREYKELTKDASQVWGESLPPIADLDAIDSQIEDLRVHGLGELSVCGLQDTYKMVIQPVSETLQELDHLFEEIKAFSAINVEKICDSILLNKLSEVLSNSPADLAIHAHPEHSLKYAVQCLEKAKDKDIKIKDSLHDISTNINVEKETRPQELDALADVLDKGTSWFMKLFSSEYRDAKKKCLALLQDPHTFKKQKSLPQQLRELAVLRWEEHNYAEEDDARKILGPLFKGTDTDWKQLSKLVRWSQSLSERLLSEGKAKLFLANFNENFEKNQRILSRISELLTALKDGIKKLGISFADDSTFMSLKSEFAAKKILIEEAQQFFAELHTPVNCDFDTLSDGVQAALAAYNVHKNISSQASKYSQVLGGIYQGVETELSLLLAVTNWLDTQKKALLAESHIEWILEGTTRERVELLKELISKAVDFHSAINNFKKSIGSKGTIDFIGWAGVQDGHIELSKIADLLQTKLNSVNHIMSWAEYNFTKQRFSEQKFEQLAEIIESDAIKPNEAVSYAQYIIYQNMAKEVIKRYPDLATFQRVSYENIRRRISTISEDIKKLSEKRICHILVNKSIPYGNGTGRKKIIPTFASL